MVFYYIAISVLGFLIFWLLTSTMFASSFPPPDELRNKNIVLLIGHPDDEAMFFAPTVIALTSPSNGNWVRIVCLSTGNAIGEGEIRKGELLNSAHRLGIRSDEDVHIVDDPRFQDGAGNDWKKEDIADFLAQWFAERAKSQSTAPTSTSTSTSNHRPQPRHQQSVDDKSTSAPPIDTILTFDPYGISTHPNHCACYHGATYFLTRLAPQRTPESSSSSPGPSQITLYTLTTVPLLRKYISILDAPLTLLSITTSLLLSNLKSKSKSKPARRNRAATARGDRVIFVSSFRDYARAFGAMVNAHRTQMLWFRWGWILAGRYMVVNDLKRETVFA